MFTAGDIDRVMKEAGLTDTSTVTAAMVGTLVGSAVDAGVMQSGITVWHVDDEDEVLVTLDVCGSLRLASRAVSVRQFLAMPSVGIRDEVLHALVRTMHEVEILRAAFRERFGSKA